MNICYDVIMISIHLGFHVLLNIISFHIVTIWFEEGITCFAGLFGKRSKRRARESLDQPSVNHMWTFLISKYCLCILAELYASTFQPQYVDGLLNPSHRKLSFTTCPPSWAFFLGKMHLLRIRFVPLV